MMITRKNATCHSSSSSFCPNKSSQKTFNWISIKLGGLINLERKEQLIKFCDLEIMSAEKSSSKSNSLDAKSGELNFLFLKCKWFCLFVFWLLDRGDWIFFFHVIQLLLSALSE